MAVRQLLDDFEEEFTCYGIQSKGMDEVKFVFHLNKLFSFQLSRIHDLDIDINNKTFCFSLYEYFDEIHSVEYFLIKNQSHPVLISGADTLFGQIQETEFILNKYKGFDYIVKIPIVDEIVVLNEVSLRSSDLIQTYSILDSLTSKEKNLLIL
ncbi:MAG: IPExxxVDY family protein [Flavobacteriaceae bacterium]|nr:IPExxxVDY family protein [Flavobacteriaceae bacterium]